MSEEIDLGSNSISIPEDAFEKFQTSAVFEEDEYILLTDIVPPQAPVPDLSHELNEIPFDNEVVLCDPPDNSNDSPVSKLASGSGSQLSDKSLQQECQDLSADVSGSTNHAIEDGASIIQDSFLSTTMNQNESHYETHTQEGEPSTYPRRTKRSRISNTAKYPLKTHDSGTTNTPIKRRPGRPKKVMDQLIQTTFEPDSTNIDNSGLFPENENGNATEGSGFEDITPTNVVKKGRRGRPKAIKETKTPAPSSSKRVHKLTKIVPHTTNDKINDNQLIESSRADETGSQIILDSHSDKNGNSFTTSCTKPKRGRKKRSITQIEATNNKIETEPLNNASDDDADDLCLSKLKTNLKDLPNSDINELDIVCQNNADATLINSADNINSTNELQSKNLQNDKVVDKFVVVDKPVVVESIGEEKIGSPTKRNSKIPTMSDFEYNIDKVVKEATIDQQPSQPTENECLLVEVTSKRRRTAKKTFVYDEGSDEDPFANMESSDDEPKRKKKNSRYQSDDEYVPGGSGGGSGKKRGKIRSSSSESDSDIYAHDDDITKTKKKTLFTPIDGVQSLDNKSFEVTTITPNKAHDDDVEVCLQSSVIKIDDTLKPPGEAWATTNAFENFIAQKNTGLQVKKVSSQEKIEKLAPLQIPVLDPLEHKKGVEISTQTKNPSLVSTSVQTSAPYDIPMKKNTSLTSLQSEKACQFLNSVVKSTVELGHLMSQKSEGFMKKKINTENVTDTYKMDYCVRKSFLLFKLAKSNLLQMEEDLAKQYDEFLEVNNLSSCRELPKKITPKVNQNDSDSDCEIVEVLGVTSSTPPEPMKNKSFNPKTVFLNKELSIKIAKKPPAAVTPSPGKKKLDIKGRHAVWINKNVMVKKVTPSQSFLAQDSRNKKPPDTVITEKMVSDFFKGYYLLKALTMCAPYVNTDWFGVRREYACYYSVNEFDVSNTSQNNEDLIDVTTENTNDIPVENRTINSENPKSLFTLCTEAICKYCHENPKLATEKQKCHVTDGTTAEGPLTLFRLCIIALKTDYHHSALQQSSCYIENHYKEDDDNSLDLPDAKYKSEKSNYKNTGGKDHTEEMCSKYNTVSKHFDGEETENNSYQTTVVPLTKICYQKVVELVYASEIFLNVTPEGLDKDLESIDNYCNIEEETYQEQDLCQSGNSYKNVMKTLFSLCVCFIQKSQQSTNIKSPISQTPWHKHDFRPKPLKTIVFETVKNIIHSGLEGISETVHNNLTVETPSIESNYLTINCINTLSEEAFERLQEPFAKIEKTHLDSFGQHDDDFDHDFHDDNETCDNGWAAQLQVQELRSFYTPHFTETMQEENSHPPHDSNEVLPRFKTEPIDEFTAENIDTSIVKAEPMPTLEALNEMTLIPDDIVTKSELIDTTTTRDASTLIGSHNFNVDTFEQFVATNKMMQFMNESTNDEIFSQSALRIRRQHEPDLDQGNDSCMSLLVPHTFEPLHVASAKCSLMEYSSEDDNNSKKNTKKKKLDKKLKKTKKDVKLAKETSYAAKDKTCPIPDNEVAVMTRRMREKIRQEERKIKSSDSEEENLYKLSTKKNKCNNENDKIQQQEKDESSDEEPDILYQLNTNKKDTAITTEEEKDPSQSDAESETLYSLASKKDKRKNNFKTDSKKLQKNKHKNIETLVDNKQNDNDIQCNNVDSTEKVIDREIDGQDKFSGFTAIDQKEISNYHKLMQFVYNKIIPTDDNDDSSKKTNMGPVIHPDEPVELLECEPTLPIFDDENTKERPCPKKFKKNYQKPSEVVEVTTPHYTDRNGWYCYSINSNDHKLYKKAQIVLDKLPESFVKTYMEYQNVMDKDLDDQEVDRLINLQSLHRTVTVKDIKDLKSKSRLKESKEPSIDDKQSRTHSPVYSDHYEELAPSDDEDPNVEDEQPPPMSVRSSENNLAKDLLMDDHDSDSEGASSKKMKEEPKDPDEKPRRADHGSKTRDKVESESLMLTADKMMNKELTLLNAPVVMQEAPVKPKKEHTVKEDIKLIKKITTRQPKERAKNDEDSSSEEEKQWVSTKEKLLKRLGKKEDAVADDAKRAKLVTEFIERRHADRKDKRSSGDVRRTRNRRKALERQKQLRFLKNELFGENDGASTKRGAAAGLFKGRKNIRKVIDKKSLARSTVVSNMEEFERKRRLNMRHNKLREVLGCEEGVNVLVINDEVCLEYDFEQQRPVVTVHQFFTKVMKAHQYEGVKFMWDACFETLGTLEAGHPGGGCILAHCMGLGKTLQVLALLHTVLTHPRSGMNRVLVCCPLSTVLNWVDEIHKWIGPVTDEIKVFELSKLRKTYERAYQLEDWYSGGGIFIIGYELFRSLTTLDPDIDDIRPTIINKIRTALLDPGPDIIVCDEGHLLKNDCSVLAVAMSRVVTRRRIVLTGTPMQNNLREYFCMVNFVKPNLLGTYSEYSNRFENPIMNGQHRDSLQEDIKLMKARTHILHKVLEGCLQRQEASVLYPYLPKKHEYTVFIPLTRCQWDLYNHYMDNYSRTTKQSVLRDFHILQKIWSHPQVLHNFQMKARDKKDKIKAEKMEDDLAHEDQEDIKPPETEVWWLQYLQDGAMLDSLDSSNKFVAVFRILHECVALGDKVLIFSTSLFCLDALEFFLKKIENWSLGQDYYRLDGSVPAEVRQKWCREFNAEQNLNTKLFLISTRAGCLGLNMTAANRVIILDTSWNPAHDIQSIFRVYRFGQKKDCYIYRLVALGTMEQKIYERSVTKQAVACRVVDEQQIDRHYNLAELTELYSVDEMGISVAGGVAVGVSDVALLRVARDAAVHAVHEHDSLLRGSSEQGLPEHERAAAWTQFQEEHEHKQMQNDISANKAKVALQRLEMKHLRKQAMVPGGGETSIKEEPSASTSLLVPKDDLRGQRGRKPKTANVVQCRIPITVNQPGPSSSPHNEDKHQQEMVTKITSLFIKHNFKHQTSNPKKIAELVSKVKQMVATGQPMALGPEYDELSSGIANVLLQREEPPPLTDIQPMPIRDQPEVKKRGRGKKKVREPSPEVAVPPEPVQPEGGRRRRKAALAAEMNFDSQHIVIDLDDDDNDWQNDVGVIDDDVTLDTTSNTQNEPQLPPKTKPKNTESSIVLSDGDSNENVTEDNDVVPLHPSLLTNDNFIKIVAHTYLAGNPMMDEDAATLAAQYSTLKTLKESENEDKPIKSGAVYDIAIKVLGKEVLRKLQAANPSVKDANGDASIAAKKLQTLLGGTAETPAPVKPRIGPKSKVKKEVVQEPDPDTHPKLKVKSIPSMSKTAAIVVPKSASFQAPGATPRAECILPDDDDVVIDPEPVVKKTTIIKKFKIGPERSESPHASVTPVAMGRGPAAARATTPTICLDSDDDEPSPQSQPKRRAQPTAPTSTAPVPVALTGPNARAIALPPAPSLGVPTSQAPVYYTLTPLTRTYTKGGHSQPVPISLTDSDSTQPVPVSLTGPGMQPVSFPQPVPHVNTYTGQGRLKPVRLRYVPGSLPVPVSLSEPSGPPVPVSLVGPDSQPISLSSQHPVPKSLVDADGQPVSLRFSNQQTPATSTAPASAPQILRLGSVQLQNTLPTSSNAPTTEVPKNKKTICKPGDVFRISQSGVVEILNRKLGRTGSSEVTHTIPDDDPAPVATTPAVSTPVISKVSKRAVDTPPDSRKDRRKQSIRKISFSSSSSSGRSRSASPDPLAILKDVVHIQAPDKPVAEKPVVKTATKVIVTNPPATQPTTTKQDPKPTTRQTKTRGSRTNDLKTKTGPKSILTESVDLTMFDNEPASHPQRTTSKAFNKNTSKLVGTSKTIVLDGKTRSLKVEGSQNSAARPKPADKRPAQSVAAPAPKKKKTEPMTLKDFDIDDELDIDNIIELD